jgi:hypothetical protein
MGGMGGMGSTSGNGGAGGNGGGANSAGVRPRATGGAGGSGGSGGAGGSGGLAGTASAIGIDTITNAGSAGAAGATGGFAPTTSPGANGTAGNGGGGGSAGGSGSTGNTGNGGAAILSQAGSVRLEVLNTGAGIIRGGSGLNGGAGIQSAASTLVIENLAGGSILGGVGSNAYGIDVTGGILTSLSNTGTISGTGNGAGIHNAGAITTLTNRQDGLSYTGTAPANYYVDIAGTTAGQYGTLIVKDSPNWNISALNFGVASGSTLAEGVIYQDVIQGSGTTSFNSTASKTGSFVAGGTTYNYSLVYDGNSWDLTLVGIYTVTFDANGGSGSMSTQSGSYNTTAALTNNAFTRTGYTFAGWNAVQGGGGAAYANGGNYTFTASNTLYAQWNINSYAVTPNAGAGGSISPSGAQTVNHGGTTSFTVTPNTGYSIASVTGCSGNLNGNTYTTAAVTGACAVSATFSANTSVTGSTAGGSVTAAITGGTCAGFVTGSTQFAAGSNAPAGQTFPYGSFGFTATGCGTSGGSVTITLNYPQGLPAQPKFYKLISGNWVDWTSRATFGANTVQYTVQDNQLGDSDPAAGVITDPVALAAPAELASIPTLNEWALMLLASLMLMLGMWQVQRRSVVAGAMEI